MPKLTFTPGAKAEPLIVTLLPVTPEEGVKEPIAGGPQAYRFLTDAGLVRPPVVTVTLTLPTAPAGASAVSFVADTIVTELAAAVPN